MFGFKDLNWFSTPYNREYDNIIRWVIDNSTEFHYMDKCSDRCFDKRGRYCSVPFCLSEINGTIYYFSVDKTMVKAFYWKYDYDSCQKTPYPFLCGLEIYKDGKTEKFEHFRPSIFTALKFILKKKKLEAKMTKPIDIEKKNLKSVWGKLKIDKRNK